MQIPSAALSFHYDRANDVLYISSGQSQPSYCDEILPGVFLRKDLYTDVATGVTILYPRDQLAKGIVNWSRMPFGIRESDIRGHIS